MELESKSKLKKVVFLNSPLCLPQDTGCEEKHLQDFSHISYYFYRSVTEKQDASLATSRFKQDSFSCRCASFFNVALSRVVTLTIKQSKSSFPVRKHTVCEERHCVCEEMNCVCEEMDCDSFFFFFANIFSVSISPSQQRPRGDSALHRR